MFGHRHECISFYDTEHITNILGYDDLSFGSDCDRAVHFDTDSGFCWYIFFGSEHRYRKLEK